MFPPASALLFQAIRQKAGISPSNLALTMQTRTPPLIRNCWQTELLAWDYTAAPDLTFSVFSECKYPHRPTCSRLTPLLTEERADPMLGDPHLPVLPHPNANCYPSAFLNTALATVRSLIRPPAVRGNLHLCRTAAPAQLPAPKLALLWRLRQKGRRHTFYP